MSTTFDSTKRGLLELLRDVHSGKLKLPDFQRGWVWDDNHILGLLASIAESFPIGAIMLLQAGNPEVKFKERVVEGVDNAQLTATEYLILDGQQRLTSLYQSIFANQPVATRDIRGHAVARWYYIDIRQALAKGADLEDAIFSTHEDRIFKNFRGEPIPGRDFSSEEKEFEGCVFPLSRIFSSQAWRTSFNQFHKYNPEMIQLWDQFEAQIIKRFEQYQIPQIVLLKDTPKVAVCQVFEKVNTGGVSLTVFELLTATFAVDSFPLRDDWAAREKELKQFKALASVENTDFLQAVTLLVTRERRSVAQEQGLAKDQLPAVSCKRKEVLRLTTQDYQKWAPVIEAGLKRTARFLTSQCIYSFRDLPYRTQLIPLAAIFALLGNKAESDAVRKKMEQWFWCGVFGELYGGAVETRSAKDLPEVLAWIDGGPEPDSVRDANFAPNRLYSLRTRNSAAYKGLHALILRGSVDFCSGVPISLASYFDDKLDIHHIFPRDWCDKNSVPVFKRDCIVNKSAISARTNRSIGGRAPSEYLSTLRKNGGYDEARQKEILASHHASFDQLAKNDFDGFLSARADALLQLIERAMGKLIARSSNVEEPDPGQETSEDEIE
jgi:hypothetical protein